MAFYVVDMHTTQISSKCVIVLVGLLSLFRQASSLACYVCESSIDEPCFSNVNNDAFKFNCSNVVADISKYINESAEHLPDLLKYYLPDKNNSFDCVTILGQAFGEKKIVRACIPTTEICDNIHVPLLTSGLITDSCERCNGDLCNSHSETIVSQLALKYKVVENIKHKVIENVKHKVENNAEAMKFDRFRIGIWCATVLLVSTFSRHYL